MPWPPPFSLYIALCDRGLLTNGRLSVTDQDAVKGSDWPLGQLVEIITNILPLYLTLFLKLNLLTLSCSHSIIDQCIERASSSRAPAGKLKNLPGDF